MAENLNKDIFVPLCNLDLDLTESLDFKNDYFKDFESKNDDAKMELLVNLIKRIKPHIDIDRLGFTKPLYESNDKWIGTYYRYYKVCLNIYLNDTYITQTGWSRKHGLNYTYFEKDTDNKIYISSFSEGHPKKELKKYGNLATI